MCYFLLSNPLKPSSWSHFVSLSLAQIICLQAGTIFLFPLFLPFILWQCCSTGSMLRYPNNFDFVGFLNSSISIYIKLLPGLFTAYYVFEAVSLNQDTKQNCQDKPHMNCKPLSLLWLMWIPSLSKLTCAACATFFFFNGYLKNSEYIYWEDVSQTSNVWCLGSCSCNLHPVSTAGFVVEVPPGFCFCSFPTVPLPFRE